MIEKGEVYCWGSAKSGELGLGIETGFLATPRRNRHLSDIKDLQVGRGFVIALTCKFIGLRPCPWKTYLGDEQTEVCCSLGAPINTVNWVMETIRCGWSLPELLE